MQYLRSIVFNLSMFVCILWYAARISLMRGDHARRWAVARRFGELFNRTLASWCGLSFVVEGADNMPAEPVVVYLKHASVWETLAAIAICPPHTWVLKRELMRIPILRRGLSALRCIPIDRSGRQAAALQVVAEGTERLGEGLNIMIFPEGTRMPPGETRRYGKSGALLAVRAGASLVPIAHNAGDYWPRKGLSKRPGTIRFCIGPPIDTAGRNAADVNAEAKCWIDMKMAEISPAHAPPPQKTQTRLDGLSAAKRAS